MLIYLIGYMYSGKTTIGRELASRLGYRFLDLDQHFEERYHTAIPIFFSRYGEHAFRIIERQLLHTTATLDHTVISTGGGTPCHFDNMEWINTHGTSVYLDTPLTTILQRAANSRKVRPILAHMSESERAIFVQEQLTHRLPFYAQASITHAADSTVEALIAKLAIISPV